jgi:3-dehydroquinate dehydratase type I
MNKILDSQLKSLSPSAIKFCLPILCGSIPELNVALAANALRYHYFEIWIDYLSEPDLTPVVDTIADYPGRIIVVSRRLGLEPEQRDLKRTLDFMDSIKASECFVDFDIRSQQELLSLVLNSIDPNRLLLSMHDYEATPSRDTLEEVASRMLSYKPWCIKFATYCQSPLDALQLFDFQASLLKVNTKHIVLGMGSEGAVTRIVSSLWGNEMIFAPFHKSSATAPGQMVYEDLAETFAAISRAFGEDNGRK